MSEGRASLTGIINASELTQRRGSLNSTDGPRGSTETMDKAHFLREIATATGGMPVAAPSENVENLGVESHLAQGLAHKTIKSMGQIAMPAEKAKPDRAIAESITLNHVNKMGEKSVDVSKVPLDSGLARASINLAINSGLVKSADPTKAPTGEPTKELLADIQKEASDVKEAQAKTRSSMDLSALANIKLKETEPREKRKSQTMARACMIHEINRTTAGQPISVPEGKVKTLESSHIATTIMHNEIKKMGVIAVPADKVPNTSPSEDLIKSIQDEVKEVKEAQQKLRKSIDLSALATNQA